MNRPQDFLKGDDSSSVTASFAVSFVDQHHAGILELFTRDWSHVPVVLAQKTDIYDQWGTYGLGKPSTALPVRTFEAMKAPLPTGVHLHSLAVGYEPLAVDSMRRNSPSPNKREALYLHLRDLSLDQRQEFPADLFTFNLFAGASAAVQEFNETGLTFQRPREVVSQRLLWNGDQSSSQSTCLSALSCLQCTATIAMSRRNFCSFRVQYYSGVAQRAGGPDESATII